MRRPHCCHWGCKEAATRYRSMPCGAVLPVCSGHYEKPAVTSARRLAALEKCVEVLRFAVDVGIHEMAEQFAEIDGVPNEVDDARQFAFDARRALAALDEKEVGGD